MSDDAGQALVRLTRTKTIQADDAAGLDAAYAEWADAADEAEVVRVVGFSAGTTLVLVIQYVGGAL